MSKITHIKDLTLDSDNARIHGERNLAMIESSLQDAGAWRSIAIDETGKVIAGNGTIEAAANVGITKVKVVDAEGDEIIAVRRKGLSEEQKLTYAISDNRTAETSTWNVEALQKLSERGAKIERMFSGEELAAIAKAQIVKQQYEFLQNSPSDEEQNSEQAKPSNAHAGTSAHEARLPIVMLLSTLQARKWREFKESIDTADDTKAFLQLLEAMEGESF